MKIRLTFAQASAFFLTFTVLCAPQNTWALIDPVFPKEISDRVTLWRNAEKFFENEDRVHSQRPIWLHMGDSLSTGWASKSSVNQRIKDIENGVDLLFDPGSFQDIEKNLPRPDNTWYAGTNLEGGLFAHIEKTTQREWVVYSTARTGSLLKDSFRDSLELGLIQEKQRQRVKLVSITLGSNDLCIASDPTIHSPDLPDFVLSKKLESLKSAYPQATFLVFAPGDLDTIQNRLFAQFDKGKPSNVAFKKYCESSLKLHCPALYNKKELKNMKLYRERIISQYKAVFQNVVDPFESELSAPTQDIRDLIGGDCFHPSKKGHEMMLNSAKDYLDSIGSEFFTR